jgi:hypothetical protein
MSKVPLGPNSRNLNDFLCFVRKLTFEKHLTYATHNIPTLALIAKMELQAVVKALHSIEQRY